MTITVPQIMPILSWGAHETPKEGACIMELASYLAGDVWTDEPQCVNKDLARLARYVNDNARTDDERRELLPLLGDFMVTGTVTQTSWMWPMHILERLEDIENSTAAYGMGAPDLSYTEIVEDLAKLLDDFHAHFKLGQREVTDQEMVQMAELTGAGV